VNQEIQPYQQLQPYQVQALWVELIVPVLTGIILVLFIAGMLRDLFKGKEVKLPG